MMFMDDAVQCALQLMKADSEKVKVRTSYNITGISFSPKELAAEIKKKIPEF
jgi:nucleoside-diphosphate-sugar epimerase